MVDKDVADALAAKLDTGHTEAEQIVRKTEKANVPAVANKVKAEKLGDVETVQIEACILAAALHCAAKNDVRYYLKGVHLFEHRENVLRVEATNGHVLFVHDYPVEKMPAWAKGMGVIVNRENLGKAVSAAGKDDGTVLELSTGIGHTHVTVGTWPDQWATFRLERFDFVPGNKIEFCAQSRYVPNRPQQRAGDGKTPAAGHKILRATAAISSGLGLGAIRRESGTPPKTSEACMRQAPPAWFA